MRTIDDYMDAAIARQGLRSDRELSRVLGFKGPAVSHWRTKRAWPSDDTMVKLAPLAGIPVEQALIDLNIWRAGPGPASAYYSQIARAIRATAAAAIVAAAVGHVASPANAAGTGPQIGRTVYIMENPMLRRRQRRRDDSAAALAFRNAERRFAAAA